MGLSSITSIPGIMRYKGYNQGAALMDFWFSKPAFAYPKYSTSNTSVVKMDWALGYKRAYHVYDDVMGNKTWVNAAAKKEIQKMLDRTVALPVGMPVKFGPRDWSMDLLDEDYVNQRSVDEYPRIDGLSAALGAFNFRVVVKGWVEPAKVTLPGQQPRDAQVVTITDVGCYIRDSYDFAGDQELGSWDEDKNTASVTGYYDDPQDRVTNKSFRDWRDKNKRGGDFIVYSDVKWEKLLNPDTFPIFV